MYILKDESTQLRVKKSSCQVTTQARGAAREAATGPPRRAEGPQRTRPNPPPREIPAPAVRRRAAAGRTPLGGVKHTHTHTPRAAGTTPREGAAPRTGQGRATRVTFTSLRPLGRHGGRSIASCTGRGGAASPPSRALPPRPSRPVQSLAPTEPRAPAQREQPLFPPPPGCSSREGGGVTAAAASPQPPRGGPALRRSGVATPPRGGGTGGRAGGTERCGAGEAPRLLQMRSLHG